MSSLSCLARLDFVFANASAIITLILDGSLEDGIAYPALIAAFLDRTPQLRTPLLENPHDVTPPTALSRDGRGWRIRWTFDCRG